MSESIVILLLAAVWVGYLTLWWRDGRKSSTTERTPSFRRSRSPLGALGSAAGTLSSAGAPAMGPITLPSLSMPYSAAAAAQRRRVVIGALTGLAVVTLLAAFALGSIFVLVNVLVDIALVAFIHACIQRRNAAAEREMKVTMLYPDRRPAQLASPGPTLRRTGSG